VAVTGVKLDGDGEEERVEITEKRGDDGLSKGEPKKEQRFGSKKGDY